MPRNPSRPWLTSGRPSACSRKLRATASRPPAETKNAWDKAAVLVQAVGALAIFVSLAALFTGVRQFNEQQKESAAQALNQQREAVLNGYLDDMSALMLRYHLSKSKPGAPVRSIAGARTLTAVRDLDGARKATLIRYLWEAGLITRPLPIVNIFSGGGIEPKVLVRFAGSGAGSSAPFLVNTAVVTVQYSYNCPSAGGSESFVAELISLPSSANGDEQIIANQISSVGSATATAHPKFVGSDYYLKVNSVCGWSILVASG